MEMIPLSSFCSFFMVESAVLAALKLASLIKAF